MSHPTWKLKCVFVPRTNKTKFLVYFTGDLPNRYALVYRPCSIPGLQDEIRTFFFDHRDFAMEMAEAMRDTFEHHMPVSHWVKMYRLVKYMAQYSPAPCIQAVADKIFPHNKVRHEQDRIVGKKAFSQVILREIADVAIATYEEYG